jgi:hypothetical protein
MLRRLAMAGLLVLAGCAGPSPSSTPVPSVVPSATPASVATPAPSTGSTVQQALESLRDDMAAAVTARDREGYLALIDQTDPVFALEHSRWADDWAKLHPVLSYRLAVAEVEAGADGSATGQVTVTWSIEGFEAPRTASWLARFTHGAAGWQYAGEVWGATDAEHFRLLVAPGVTGADGAILPALPDVYELVTSTLDYAPAGSMQIKVYDTPEALVANTLLSLPLIRGWNEPGEALKLFYDPADTSLTSVVAHEFTHFTLFDRAGTKRTRMPWWLDEGTASYVARSLEGGAGGTDNRLDQVAQWARAGELADWDDMAVFETTPIDLWRFVYPMGYAMVTYVSDEYGGPKRNAWLAAMATEQAIDQATPAALGVTFDELDAGFRSWILAR